MTIFVNGKQKRIPRRPLIEELPVDEFLARNADPIWLHQNELWEMIPADMADMNALDDSDTPTVSTNLFDDGDHSGADREGESK